MLIEIDNEVCCLDQVIILNMLLPFRDNTTFMAIGDLPSFLYQILGV